jgi:DtxR family Mn-dependent transcriptional regulator
MGNLNFEFWSWAVLTLALLTLLFLPRQGFLAHWKEYRKAQQKEKLEDALKYMFDQQQIGITLTLQQLAGELKSPLRQVGKMAAKMAAQELVTQNAEQIALTPAGEKIAIQVLRAHRLWERYLADEARVPLAQVHQLAHRREHGMSPSQINALDAALGHPLRDPHGDPIPDPRGSFRPFEKGLPLTQWDTDQEFSIVHLEDEPPLAYAQILAEGLYLGQQLSVLDKNETRIRLSDGIDEFTLAPAVAANIFVQALKKSEIEQKSAMPLGALAANQKAEIVLLDEQCQGFTRRRFLDLGLTPGTLIYPELSNAFGDPRAYRVRGTLIALRKDQASLIWVNPIPEAQPEPQPLVTS